MYTVGRWTGMWKEEWMSVCGLQFIRLRTWCCWFKHRCGLSKINTPLPPNLPRLPTCTAQSSQHLQCRDQEGRETLLRSWVSEVWEPVREPAYWLWCGWGAQWSLEGNQSQVSLLLCEDESLWSFLIYAELLGLPLSPTLVLPLINKDVDSGLSLPTHILWVIGRHGPCWWFWGLSGQCQSFCSISFGSKSIVVFLRSFLEEKRPFFPAWMFLHLHCLSPPCHMHAHMEISPFFGWWKNILEDHFEKASLLMSWRRNLLCSVLGSLQIKLTEDRLAREKTVYLRVQFV